MVISRPRVPYQKPGFQEKSLMIISLISNNFDASKIHYVVVTWEANREQNGVKLTASVPNRANRKQTEEI